MLTKRGHHGEGTFLIRPNSRRPGYYALTLLFNAMPYHYEIVCEVSGVGCVVSPALGYEEIGCLV